MISVRSLPIIILVLAVEHGTANSSSSFHPSTAAPPYQDHAGARTTPATTTMTATATTCSIPHDPTAATKQPSRRTSQRTNIMKIKEMSLLLRWTCEMNRRLQAATTASSEDEYDVVSPPPTQHHDTTSPVGTNPLRGGQTAFYRIPSALVVRSTNDNNNNNKPVVASSDKSDLTIFHAKTPRTGRRGVARWGPDLNMYLHKVAETLDVKEGSIEWTLALLYLDRACSVETPRSNGIPAIPFLGPRTVHRLVLAALFLAVRATRADDQQGAALMMNQYYSRLSSAFGIPKQHLSLMVDWMQGALGDLGLFVAPYQVQEFGEKWYLKFGRCNEDVEVGSRPQ